MMKLRVLFLALWLPLLGYTQEKQHFLSVSAGVWENDGGYWYQAVDFSFGPAFALEYQYLWTDHIALRGKFSTGAISRKTIGEIARPISATAGILWTPFGKKFKNFQVGVSPGYVYCRYDYMDVDRPVRDQHRIATHHTFGIEYTVRFHFINNERYVLGLNFDLITIFAGGHYQIFTLQNMLSFGLKF